MDDQPTAQMPTTPETPTPPPAAAAAQTPPTDQGRPSWLVLAAIAILLLALVACGIGYMGEVRRSNELEEQLEATEDRLDALEDDATDADTSPDEDDATEDTGDEDDADDGDADADDPVEEDPGVATDSEPDGRYIGRITDVFTEDGTRYIEIDFIQFLVGDEAAAAATAHGDESPPPNDYYIVNDNPMLRVFPVDDDLLEVTTWTWPGHVSEIYPAPFDTWSANRDALGPHWVVIADDTIVQMEEQYLP
jgi:type II secretory pathway pseudopilin PulG